MLINTIRKVTDFKWLNLYVASYTAKNGKMGSWFFASRQSEIPERGIDKAKVDAVVIVPVHVSPLGRRLVVTKEFRVPINGYEFGLPAGLIDPDEGIEKCAARELEEETGLKVTKVTKVSPPIYSSAGLTDESIQYVFLECEGVPHTTNLQDTEDIETILLDCDGVVNLMNQTGEYANVKVAAKLWSILYAYSLTCQI